MATDYHERLRLPVEGNSHTRFETGTGLHVGTGYTRIVIGERGPYIEFLPGQIVWESLHVPDEEVYRTAESWKNRVYYAEWRTRDESRVKVYEQYRPVEYADYKVGLIYISSFDLFADGEPIITKLERKRKPKNDVVDLFGDN